MRTERFAINRIGSVLKATHFELKFRLMIYYGFYDSSGAALGARRLQVKYHFTVEVITQLLINGYLCEANYIDFPC